MNTELLKILAMELAKQMNSVINIPFVSEEEEELFFQYIILNVLHLLVNKLSKNPELKEGL